MSVERCIVWCFVSGLCSYACFFMVYMNYMSCNECIYLVLWSWSIASSVTLLFMDSSPSATETNIKKHSLFSFFLYCFFSFFSLLCHSHSHLPLLCLSPSFYSFYTLDLLYSISATLSNSPRVVLRHIFSFFLFGILGLRLLEVHASIHRYVS